MGWTYTNQGGETIIRDGEITPWSEITITNGRETLTLMVTTANERAFYGVPLGADSERVPGRPDTRDNRTMFPRPEWSQVVGR